MRTIPLALAACALLVTGAGSAAAQSDDPRPGPTGSRLADARLPAPRPGAGGAPGSAAAPDDDPGLLGLPEGTVGVAKWITLGASAGLAAYGFDRNDAADELFRELETICESQPDRCFPLRADGTYADDELEAIFQEVRELDGRARIALIASQVGIAASVLLFILDLPEDDSPPDIPFDPPRIGVGADGSAHVSVTVPAGFPGAGGR